MHHIKRCVSPPCFPFANATAIITIEIPICNIRSATSPHPLQDTVPKFYIIKKFSNINPKKVNVIGRARKGNIRSTQLFTD